MSPDVTKCPLLGNITPHWEALRKTSTNFSKLPTNFWHKLLFYVNLHSITWRSELEDIFIENIIIRELVQALTLPLPSKTYLDSYTLPSFSHTACQSSCVRLTPPSLHDLTSSHLLKGITEAILPSLPCVPNFSVFTGSLMLLLHLKIHQLNLFFSHFLLLTAHLSLTQCTVYLDGIYVGGASAPLVLKERHSWDKETFSLLIDCFLQPNLNAFSALPKPKISSSNILVWDGPEPERISSEELLISALCQAVRV